MLHSNFGCCIETIQKSATYKISGDTGTTHKFTGKERDSESGLDNFGARYDSSSLGRFLSPDPLGGAVGDLQSHNAYAYVLNNPTDLIDPLGLDPKKKKKNPPIGAACRNPMAGCTPPLSCLAELNGCPGSDCSISLDGVPAPCNMVLSLLFSGSAEINGENWWAATGFETERGWVRTPSTLLDLALGEDGETCVQPRKYQKAGIAIQAAAAKLLNVTLGVGAGISGAGGNRVGVSFTFSQQVVVSPNGQAAFATVFTSLHSIPFAYVSPGVGGYGGFQLSISNAKTPKDIGGLFLSGGYGGGKGWGGGVDAAGGVGTQGNFVWQVTGTGPFGYSVPTSVGHATAFTNTLITPICKD